MSKNHARVAGLVAASLPETLPESLSALLDSAELREAFVPHAPLPAGHARNLKRKSAFHACTAASAAATREDQMVFAALNFKAMSGYYFAQSTKIHEEYNWIKLTKNAFKHLEERFS